MLARLILFENPSISPIQPFVGLTQATKFTVLY